MNKSIQQLEDVECEITEREKKLAQLKVSMRDAQTQLEAIEEDIIRATTDKEAVLDLFASGEASEDDLRKVRRKFDDLETEKRNLLDLLPSLKIAIPRHEGELSLLRNQKLSIERGIWTSVLQKIKDDLRASATPAVLEGIAAMRLLGSPLCGAMVADLFFEHGVPADTQLNQASAQLVKKHLGGVK